jgi:hypothetical protein
MRRATILLACLLTAPSYGCGNRCDCPDELSLLGFTLVDGEFEGDVYEIAVTVDGQSRATCSSDFAAGTDAVVECDDPTVEVTQNATTLSVTLPEFQEGTEVSIQVVDGQGLIWTGSATVLTRFYDSLDTCFCPFGDGVGDVAPSEGG